MHVKHKALARALLAISGIGTLGAAQIAIAQQAPAPQRVERIEVTGSNIKRIDVEGVAPVQVITKADIERSGKSTIADVLRSISANSGNSLSEVFTNSFSPGAAGASLRGLGQKNTLVLLNGRRLANYGFAQNLQDTYVDLNTIPATAVERIEVLKDGASAVYGSDAIGGVINIILRNDYRGAEVGVSGGTSSEGGLNEYRASLAAGIGDLAKDRYNLLGSIDYLKRDLLLASEREFTRDQDTRAFPGGALNWSSIGTYRTTPRQPFATCGTSIPGTLVPGAQLASTGTLCAANPAQFITLFPKTERLAFLGRGTFELSSTMTAFAEASYSNNKTFQTATPSPLSNTSVAYNPDTGGVRIINGTLPVGNSSNPFTTATPFNYVFYDVGPRNTDIDSKSYRLLGGLKGNAGTWDWESAAGHAENKVAQINYNRVDALLLLSAIANNTYNFLNPRNGSVTADTLRINPRRDSLSKLDFIDFKVSSEIATLPAGPLGFAAGVEYRRESIVDRPDALLTTGHVLGQGSTATDGSRNNTAGFFEFSVPVLKNLEMQIAGRQDKYSDFGSAFSPKFGIKWNPARELIVRGTVSRGFRAPTLPENARSSATFFTSVVDTFAGSPNVGRSVNIAGVFAGNQNLKPERSRNYNLGIVWEPSNDLNIGLGYYKIEQNNVVSSNGFQTVVSNPAQYPGQILRGADGTLIAVFDQFRNLALLETSGIDLDFRKTFTTSNWGKFTVNGDWVFISTFKSQPAEGQDIVDYIDSNGFQGGGQPRFKGRLGLTWDMGPFSTTLNRLYNHSWDQQQVSVPPAQERIGSYQQYDLFLAYNGFKNLKLYASIQNLLDAKPPFDPQNGGTATTVQYDISQNDLRGRYYTIGMKYSF